MKIELFLNKSFCYNLYLLLTFSSSLVKSSDTSFTLFNTFWVLLRALDWLISVPRLQKDFSWLASCSNSDLTSCDQKKKQGFCTGLRRSGFTDYPLIHPANLNSLPVVVHAAVWKPNRGQSLLSALHEGLQVNLQTLVAFQFGQQHFELSFPLCLAGLCISVTLAEVMKADLEAWRCGGVWALQKAGNRVPSCFYTALPGQQLLTKFLPEKKG